MHVPTKPVSERMDRMPDVRVGGGFASADTFGAGKYRQLQQFGGAMLHAGTSVMAEAQRRMKDHDDSVALSVTDQMHRDWRDEQEKAVFSTHGRDAAAAPEMTEKWFADARKRYAESLENDHQRKAFEQAYAGFKAKNLDRAMAHRDRQDLIFQQETLDAVNNTLGLEAADNAAAANTPDGRAANRARLDMIRQNINKKLAGAPEEAKALAIRQEEGAFHTLVMEAMEPKEAIAYLDREAAQALGPAKSKELKEKYQASADNADISRTAMAWVDAETLPDVIMKQAYEMYADDPAKAKQLISISDVYASKKASAAQAKAVAYKDAAYQDLAKNGYNIDKIPPEIAYGNPALYKELVEHVKWRSDMAKAFGKLDPNYGALDAIERQKPSQIRAWLDQPGNYDLLMRYAADDKTEINKIREKSNQADTPEGGGTGSGGGGNSTAVDADDWFQNNYGAMYETGWWWKGPDVYNPKSEEAKRQMNGFRVRYKSRVGQKQAEIGRKLNYQEQEEVGYQLIRDVKSGKVKLDSAFYDEQQAAASPEIPVAKEHLTSAEKAIVGSAEVISIIDPTTKETARFGQLNPKSEHLPRNIADLKADRILRATTRGSMKGLAYEAGDYVAEKNGQVWVYDKTSEFKNSYIPPQAPMVVAAAQQAPEAPESPALKDNGEPAWQKPMLDLRDKWGVKMDATWDAGNGMWVVNTPVGRYLFDRGGKQIGVRRGANTYSRANYPQEKP